jgi:hypothetical protein
MLKRILLLLALLALMLFITPFAAQPVQVGGDFGRSWLNSYGSKTAAEELSSGLWTWGAVPKGQVLVNGTLEPMGTSTWYYPSFPENSSPIILNSTSPAIDAVSFPLSDSGSPYLLEDPWFVAQMTGHPVMFRTMP